MNLGRGAGALLLLSACGAVGAPSTDGALPSVVLRSDLPAWATGPGSPPRFGFWGLNGHVSPEGFADLRGRFGLGIFQVASEDPGWTVGTLLPMVRAAGLQVTLRLTGDHERYTTADGDFDPEAWKAELDRWDPAALTPFITDGTLAGHMLLDDVRTFPGRPPDAATLDELARYSQSRLPGLLTYVREQATKLPKPADGRYHHLDAQVNQYEAAEGDVEAYARREAAAAHALDLGLINGLNIADGGDGSAGHAGWRADHWPMTAAEITRYGAVLADVPSCGMFLAWEYDGEERWTDGSIGADWFDAPDRQAALRALADRVAAHPPIQLRRPVPPPR